mmetsp:Transcript_21758/g.49201  ORF Transcript_21758/g.49201 Transcript_21758/m.49201 type:complete len:348 (-) Transcript_21758:228-1271(-)|eukprot:CAMPEP_0172615772 /NCGR_PEP_ID=MMETSP1068-20121228/62494_1 /TAXON_ID=35684 /ORGANISM="Pseudopedinella elastica, Strain CCMP716" /LENGTH=347 /DNA_ID=CAMNT_0013421021 /DNA_START=54 /DNA_END=1097 /DNA_ORIENTATION=+
MAEELTTRPNEGEGSASDSTHQPAAEEVTTRPDEDEGSKIEDTQQAAAKDQRLQIALKAVARMNALLALQKKQNSSENLMRQVGDLKRRNALLAQILVVVIAWLGLAIGAVSSFVSPESFEAWREGITIQLIRRTKQTNLTSLYLRRTFGYLCERAFFEIPNTLFAALRSPRELVLGLVLAFPAAALLRAASPYECDTLLALGCFLVGQLLYLGDDLRLPVAPQMALVGGFSLMVGGAVLLMPLALRKLHKPKPWGRYRAQILRALREESGVAPDQTPEQAAAGGEQAGAFRPPPPLPPQGNVIRRGWHRFLLSQKHRRHTCTSWEFGMMALANATVYMIDTLIAHD